MNCTTELNPSMARGGTSVAQVSQPLGGRGRPMLSRVAPFDKDSAPEHCASCEPLAASAHSRWEMAVLASKELWVGDQRQLAILIENLIFY